MRNVQLMCTKKLDLKTDVSIHDFFGLAEMCYVNKSLKQHDWRAEETSKDRAPLEHVLRPRATVCVSLWFMNKIR